MSTNIKEEIEITNPFEVKEIIHVTRKRKSLLIFIFIFTFIFSTIYFYYSQAVYLSNFTIYCNILTPSQTQILVDYLQSLIELNNTKKLFKELNMEQNDNNQKISLSNISSYFKHEDNTIEIRISTYSPELIYRIKDGVLFYLNNNPFVAKRVVLKKNKSTELLEVIKTQNDELKDVNQLLISVLQSQNTPKNVILFPQGENNSTIVSLKNQELSLLIDMELMDAFQILTEPIIPTSPNRSGLFKKLLIINIASLVAGLLLAIFLENKKYLLP